jgi:hypothetical protein
MKDLDIQTLRANALAEVLSDFVDVDDYLGRTENGVRYRCTSLRAIIYIARHGADTYKGEPPSMRATFKRYRTN